MVAAKINNLGMGMELGVLGENDMKTQVRVLLGL